MKDQDVLDIVCDVSRELRFSPTFCAMLHKLDADEARRVTGRYLEFLYKVLEEESTPASLWRKRHSVGPAQGPLMTHLCHRRSNLP